MYFVDTKMPRVLWTVSRHSKSKGMLKIEIVGNSTESVVSQKSQRRTQYQFIERVPNPMYHASRREIPYRVKLPLSVLEIGGTPSVLSIMRNNVTANSGRNNGHVMVEKPPMIMTSQPRNITKLLKTVRDVNTGEMTASEIIETNDTFLRLKRRKRALKSFTDYFEPLYRRRKVTLLFITFTIANENGVTLRSVIDQFKKRCKRNGYPCHGYFWVMEISEDLHVHYHGLFAIDRMNVRGSSIPNWWKLDELWGARTTVEMVKRSVHGYLAKYMDKGHEKIEGKRMYGRSMPSIKNSDEAATKN
jgi:hypothetical protein